MIGTAADKYEKAKELFGYPLTYKQTQIGDFESGKLVIPRKNILVYCQAEIPKKVGHRTIFIPSPELMRIQKRILRFLKKVWASWHADYCGLHHGSYADHARRHADYRWIFQFDIKDAFPSVNIELLRQFIFEELVEKIGFYKWAVERYQRELKQAERIKKEHANDDFWIRWVKESVNEAKKDVVYSPFYRIFGEKEMIAAAEAQKLADLIIDLTTLDDILPQGTPTAPFLFYVYLVKNHSINKIFNSLMPFDHWPYRVSCYVDGFVISSPRPIPSQVKEEVLKAIEGLGLKINKNKTRERDCRHSAAMITGLAVDGTGKARLSKKTVRKWRGVIHRAACETDTKQKEKLIKRIKGFVSSLKPIYGDKIPPQIAKPLSKLYNPL